MNHTRNDFLPGSGFPCQADRGVGIGHLGDLLEEDLHLLAAPDDIVHAVEFLHQHLEALDLPGHTLLRQRLFDVCLQVPVIEWFREVPYRASLNRLHGVRYGAMRGGN